MSSEGVTMNRYRESAQTVFPRGIGRAPSLLAPRPHVLGAQA
ncbi:hypothetical protein [Dyella sp.]